MTEASRDIDASHFAIPSASTLEADASLRRAHLRRLLDLAFLLWQRGDVERCRWCWTILSHCHEAESWWDKGLGVELTRHELSRAKRRPNEERRIDEESLLMLRKRVKDPVEQLRGVTMHYIEEGKAEVALDQLDMQLSSKPYSTDPILHYYAALCALAMAQQTRPVLEPVDEPTMRPSISFDLSEAVTWRSLADQNRLGKARRYIRTALSLVGPAPPAVEVPTATREARNKRRRAPTAHNRARSVVDSVGAARQGTVDIKPDGDVEEKKPSVPTTASYAALRTKLKDLLVLAGGNSDELDDDEEDSDALSSSSPPAPRKRSASIVSSPSGSSSPADSDYVDQPAANGAAKATLLLLHGFPDQWYGYRWTVGPWTERGWRVIIPSMMGYSTTAKPDEVRCYGFKSSADDLAALLDEAKVDGPLVVVGHDWGGLVAWRFAAYHPKRTTAVVVFCTPYTAPGQRNKPFPSHEWVVRNLMPFWGYQLFFKSDEAPAIMDRNTVMFHAGCFSRKVQNSQSKKRSKPDYAEQQAGDDAWAQEGGFQSYFKTMDEARDNGNEIKPPMDRELQTYLDIFKEQKTIKYALNWYKTWNINHDDEVAANLSPDFPSHIPALFWRAEFDGALPPSMSKSMGKRFKGKLDIWNADRADHWLLQDEMIRDRLTKETADWIEEQLSSKAKL